MSFDKLIENINKIDNIDKNENEKNANEGDDDEDHKKMCLILKII